MWLGRVVVISFKYVVNKGGKKLEMHVLGLKVMCRMAEFQNWRRSARAGRGE